MNARIRVASALAPLLLLVGCGQPSGSDLLQRRLATTMAPDQTCNRVASVQYLPDGARISVPANALFKPGRSDLTDCGQYAMASAIEAMLAPQIMHVGIEAYGNVDQPYALLARQRAERLRTMFSNAGLVPAQIQPAAAPAPDTWGIVLTAGESG
jgi:hypothetical protein